MKTKLQSEKGQAITESLITLMLLMLIFFGLIQMFNYSIANMTSEYATFIAARSASVGFREELVDRAANVALIPASGRPIDLWSQELEYNDTQTVYAQVEIEEAAIPNYIRYGNKYYGYNRMIYEYSREGYNEKNSWLRDYDIRNGNNAVISKTRTFCNIESGDGDTVTARAGFRDYPFIVPFAEAFVGEDKNIDIGASANNRNVGEIRNYSKVYFEE